MKTGKLLNKEKIIHGISNFSSLRFKTSHSSLLHISMLILILIIAATVRLLPLRWGYQLSEFDPHMHYRLTKHMVDNGFFAWSSWTDTMSWYPDGLKVSNSIYPGLASTAAFFYQIANALHLTPGPIVSSSVYHPLTADSVFNFVILFPVIMATLTVLVIYFLGRDIGGKEVGLFSAFFLALSSPYISRTSLGFFDDETVGIFGILLFTFFFLRSIDSKRSLKNFISYSVFAGLSLGYLFSSWGAARYPLGITLIFVLVLLLLKKYSTQLFISYVTTFGVALLIAINVPKLGVEFLAEPTVLAVAGMFLILTIFEISQRINTNRNKILFIIGFISFIAILFFGLSWLGLIGSLPEKFIATLFPGERIGETPIQQLVQSVQEHRPATWGSIYFDLGIGVLFIPVGLYFAVQNPTKRNIFLIIFGITSIYFAGSMVRLTLLMAPIFSILWAIALVQVVKPFATILRESPGIQRRKMRFKTRVGKEFSAGFIIFMFILLTVTFVLPGAGSDFPRVIDRANSPTTIAAASLPLKPPEPVSDWLDALNWMRVNLESNDVVASWWDYGYWITAIANKTTLADNGTGNVTKIGEIGKMFMSNETEAIKFLKEYDVKYVVIYQTFRDDGSDAVYGDEGKWRWMAKIPGLDDISFGNYTLGTDWIDTNEDNQISQDELIPNDLGSSTVLYKLMHYSRDILLRGSSEIELEYFEGPPKGYFSQQTGSILGFRDSQGTFTPMVCVYKVKYD